MAKGNCTVKFYLKSEKKKSKKPDEPDKKKAKELPIYCRIIYNRKKAEFNTGERLAPSSWSSDSGMPIRQPRLKEYLINVESNILEGKRTLEYQSREVSAKVLRDYYKFGDDKESISFCSYFTTFFKEISLKPDNYGVGTLKKYNSTEKHFNVFLKSQKKSDLTFEEFDLETIKGFDQYSLTTKSKQFDKPMSRNTANSYHRKIKAVLSSAVKEDLIQKNPYINFPIKDEKTNRTFLTKEELYELEKHALGDNDALKRVRDVFLFSCYTGIRYQDAQELVSDKGTSQECLV